MNNRSHFKLEFQAHKKKLPRDIRMAIFTDDKDLDKQFIHLWRENKKLKRQTAFSLSINFLKRISRRVL